MWPDGDLRPCVENWAGAGAVITALPGMHSPEALLTAAFGSPRESFAASLRQSSSGKELIERGFAADLELAAELNVSSTVPRLVNRAFSRSS